MIDYPTFSKNLNRVQERIRAACAACGRKPTEVTLLPVTKTQPAEAIDYVLRCGLLAVGENRVQEVIEKLKPGVMEVRWELIGHLQSNKAKMAVEHFSRIQSVDSVKLLYRLERLAAEKERVLPILLQINAGDRATIETQFGVSYEGIDALMEGALGCPHLKVEGLMTIAPPGGDSKRITAAFRRLRKTRDRLRSAFGLSLPELSMGMTGDLEIAIQEGSTLVRVGTALFGKRGRVESAK